MLADKTVLVTGASRGIGRAIAEQLAAKGAFVYGTATREEGASTISERFKEAGHTGQGLVLDVTNIETMDKMLSDMSEGQGMPDIVVHNAGITRDNLLMRMKDEEWHDVIETNLTAIYRLSRACLRNMMKKRWGRMIAISSVVGVTGNPGQANYCAAKAGVIGFCKSLAHEIASRDITVNVVAPGFIATDMTSRLTEAQSEAIINNVPMGRMGSADDIAAAVSFLASEGASYITGQTIHVNGGMFMA